MRPEALASPDSVASSDQVTSGEQPVPDPSAPSQIATPDQLVPGQLIPDQLAPDQTKPPGVNWRGVFLQSLEFLAVEHGFRYMTEEGTRHPHDKLFPGYLNSLSSLHGWADGDPFYVNYVGHPMQGSVAGYIFAQNDNAFRGVEIGKNPRYWKSRRARLQPLPGLTASSSKLGC